MSSIDKNKKQCDKMSRTSENRGILQKIILSKKYPEPLPKQQWPIDRPDLEHS